ncbi:hypothetical protein PR048_027117 [Dryococelus australis]|uniref:Uncharacterized protein n=1 Tax=Dryococelus australis TaxID=614101 RepID=A0ABQ9GEK0_9NEOP|nr:hypothetical protein PR048_027117 [Dryococelus australis]
MPREAISLRTETISMPREAIALRTETISMPDELVRCRATDCREEFLGRLLTASSWEPMRVIEMSMEQRRNERPWGETGDTRENPLTSGNVRHDSHMRKSGIPVFEPDSSVDVPEDFLEAFEAADPFLGELDPGTFGTGTGIGPEVDEEA